MTKEVAHIGLSSGCVFHSGSELPLWGSLNGRLSHFPWHSCNGSTPPPPSHQSVGRSHLPDLAVGSSASQQLPNNAGPGNRLPCQLQVCQPWACQITVSVNSERRGEGGGMKREMGECGRERGGGSRVGRVGLEEMERMWHLVTHMHRHTHTHGLTYISLRAHLPQMLAPAHCHQCPSPSLSHLSFR